MRGNDHARLSLRPRSFGEASDLVPSVLDRAGGPTTMVSCPRGGDRAPLTLNLLPAQEARGLLNLVRIPRIQVRGIGGLLAASLR